MPNSVIATDRLLLRPFAPRFAPTFFQGIDKYREDLVTYFPKTCALNISLLATEAYMFNKQQERKRKECYANAIFLKADKGEQLIGMLSVRGVDWRVPKGELAYFIFPPHQRKGYAKEALTTFKKWCFNTLAIHRLYMEVGVKNEESQALARSCGFVQEGHLRQHYRNGKGDLEDTLVFGTTCSSV